MSCPSCHRENPPEARFCMHCAAPLARVCASCRTSLPPEARFCLGCGRALDDAAPRAASATPSPAPASVIPGSIASGRYQIERFLGEGGKKRVYLARDARLSREVALALIKTEGLDEASNTRVRREAQAMGQLGDHPHIVTVHDIGEEQKQLFIVSQYMAGGDVEARIRSNEKGRLSIEEALRIGEEICSALEHAHGHGLIHRDLKPGNLWLADDGTAKLGDFGLAVSLGRSRITREGMMVGTAAYMAPEQALGRPPDARSDLYSLGATLYEMLTGRPPFLGDDAVAVISQHINTPPVRPSWHNPEVSRELDALVLGLLEKDPERRPAKAAEVREALGRIREGAGTAFAQPEPSRSQTELQRGVWGRFIGRSQELGQLKSAFDRSLSGDGTVLMVVGEPGIGKTRLVEELGVYARLRGAQVLSGRCFEGEVALPYFPFIEALRSYVRSRPDAELLRELGEGAPEIATLLSEIRQRFPELPQAPRLEGDAERLRLFESVASFVRSASGSQPLVISLDDLHWADKPSLLLLQYLARGARGHRILLVGAYRDVDLERTHPLAEIAAGLRHEHLSERVLLRGLPIDEVQALLSAAGEQEFGIEVARLIHRETEGNPFFIEEIVKHLVETGAVDRRDGVWIVEQDTLESTLPEGVREVIGRRLSRLSRECNQMLSAASAMPGGFAFEMLARLVEGGEEATLDVLDEALRSHIIRERADGAGSYEFDHALIRQTLYRELNTPRRVRLHRQIGEAMEVLWGTNPEPHLSELAHHFFQALPGGDPVKALEYAKRAGVRARALLAFEEAAGHYDRALQALELAESDDALERCQLLLGLGEAQRLAGARDQARETFLRTIALARNADLPEQQARAALGISGEWGALGEPDEEVTRVLEVALEALPVEDSGLRARLLTHLSLALSAFGRLKGDERQEATSRDALAMARRVGDPLASAEALWAMLQVRSGPQDTDECLALCAEMIELGRAAGVLQQTLHGWYMRIFLLLRLGDIDGAETDIEHYEHGVEKLRQPLYRRYPVSLRAMLAMLAGRFDEAERLGKEALNLARRCQDPLLAMSWTQLAALYQQRGTLEEWEAASRARSELESDTEWGWRRIAELPLWCARGRDAAVREALEGLDEQLLTEFSKVALYVPTLASLSRACVHLGDARRAAGIYRALRPWADAIITLPPAALCLGSTAHQLGILARTMEHFDGAERHFEEALVAHQRLRSPPLVALTQAEYARLLLDRHAEGDVEKAIELANAALETAQSLGMKLLLEQALGLKLEAQGVDRGETRSSIYAVVSKLNEDGTDFSGHAAADGNVTLMFSDMEGFTEMTERLGDREAHRVIRDHNGIVREQLAAHGGTEVELQGDGFLLAFGSAGSALRCALAIQQAFAAYNAAGPGEPIRVRIGLHTGQVIKEADRFFGRTVILAARIADTARGGEIMVSAALRQAVSGDESFRFGDEREARLKGFSDSQSLFPLRWE